MKSLMISPSLFVKKVPKKTSLGLSLFGKPVITENVPSLSTNIEYAFGPEIKLDTSTSAASIKYIPRKYFSSPTWFL